MNTKTLVGKVMEGAGSLVGKVKKGAKGLAVAGVIGLASLAYDTNKANADVIRIHDWDYFTQGWNNVAMVSNNDDFTDNSNVPTDRDYRFCFSLNDSGTERIAGEAGNDNFPYGIQKLLGSWDLNEGDVPTGMIGVHDLTGDGFADYDTVTGFLELDATDDFFIAGNFFGMVPGMNYGDGKVVGGIELDGVLDNIGAIPSRLDSWVRLPSINLVSGSVNPIPEPSTLALLGLGAGAVALGRRKKRK